MLLEPVLDVLHALLAVMNVVALYEFDEEPHLVVLSSSHRLDLPDSSQPPDVCDSRSIDCVVSCEQYRRVLIRAPDDNGLGSAKEIPGHLASFQLLQ